MYSQQFGTVFNRDKFEWFHIESPQTVTDRANGITLRNQKPDHLNSEEKRMLGKVIAESPEILRDNSIQLTFINKIKHNNICKKGNYNANVDALSRVVIHLLEIADNESTAVNLDDQDLPDLSVEDINAILDDIQHQKPPNGNTRSENIPGTSASQNGIIHVESAPREPNENASVDDTVHTALENPTVTLPHTEKSLNVHANQIIIEHLPNFNRHINYYSFFSTDFIVSDNIILFKIHVPIVSKPYDYFHLFPVYLNNHAIIPETPYLLFDNKNYWNSERKCESVGNMYFCKREHLTRGNSCLKDMLIRIVNTCPVTAVTETLIQKNQRDENTGQPDGTDYRPLDVPARRTRNSTRILSNRPG
ncbi:hypothetical protein Trydic_g21087 [Trypoxylus dichotomus]